MPRRTLLALTVLAFLTCPRLAAAAPQSLRLFSPRSVWNAHVQSGAAVDPASASKMEAIRREAAKEIKQGIGPWISETSYSTPLYIVGAAERPVRVHLDDMGSWGAPLQGALNGGVPIPAGALPASGTDGHLTVYQPATDKMWEFWQAAKKADGWHASWGGAMNHVSSSPGYYTDHSWPGLTSQAGWNWGSTATSLPVIAGTVTIAELRRGRIDHALAIALPDACAKVFAWPAQRTDGGDRSRSCVPEGAHIRIDPNVDLDALHLPAITLTLARAAQRYGMIVRDRTNHAIGFYAEDPTRLGKDPYAGPKGLFHGLQPWDFLPQFPWGHLQLVRMHLCSDAPCAPPATTARHA